MPVLRRATNVPSSSHEARGGLLPLPSPNRLGPPTVGNNDFRDVALRGHEVDATPQPLRSRSGSRQESGVDGSLRTVDSPYATYCLDPHFGAPGSIPIPIPVPIPVPISVPIPLSATRSVPRSSPISISSQPAISPPSHNLARPISPLPYPVDNTPPGRGAPPPTEDDHHGLEKIEEEYNGQEYFGEEYNPEEHDGEAHFGDREQSIGDREAEEGAAEEGATEEKAAEEANDHEFENDGGRETMYGDTRKPPMVNPIATPTSQCTWRCSWKRFAPTLRYQTFNWQMKAIIWFLTFRFVYHAALCIISASIYSSFHYKDYDDGVTEADIKVGLIVGVMIGAFISVCDIYCIIHALYMKVRVATHLAVLQLIAMLVFCLDGPPKVILGLYPDPNVQTVAFRVAGGWSFGSLIFHILTPFFALYAAKTWEMHMERYGPPDYMTYGTHQHPEPGQQMYGWLPGANGQQYQGEHTQGQYSEGQQQYDVDGEYDEQQQDLEQHFAGEQQYVDGHHEAGREDEDGQPLDGALQYEDYPDEHQFQIPVEPHEEGWENGQEAIEHDDAPEFHGGGHGMARGG